MIYDNFGKALLFYHSEILLTIYNLLPLVISDLK